MSVVLIEQDMAILAVTAMSDVAGDAKVCTLKPEMPSATIDTIASLSSL